jgi:hypothetical protein
MVFVGKNIISRHGRFVNLAEVDEVIIFFNKAEKQKNIS